MRRSSLILAAVIVFGLAVRPSGQQAPAERPIFRSGRDLVSVDVVVRDRSGAIVRGLTAADFDVREDGRAEDILTVSFQEIAEQGPGTALRSADLLAGVNTQALQARSGAAAASSQDRAADFSPEALAGRRLMALVFDLSSMQPDDVQRAIDSANTYVSQQMSPADLVAVATVSSSLDVLTDFTADREKVASVLAQLAYTDGTSTVAPTASTAATDEQAAAATDDSATATDTAELDLFNNDIRLRALKALAEALGHVQQKKAIIYFSGGMQRSGQDNQVELRAAINAAVRANVSIYPVDTGGLQAVVPGGDARQASGRGVSLFSGRGVAAQFDKLAASQDTLTAMAADTGGQAFLDTNDFGEAFTRVQRDTSAYYLIGYSSSNTAKDGRFRRIQVRVKRDGLRVEARAGYYAERDFSHTSRTDRETQLQDELFAAVSATDLPVLVGSGWFRLASDRYYVPIGVAVPGSAVPVANATDKVSLDVLGMVRDEQGRPVGRFRQTLQLPPGTAKTLAGKQVVYQSAVTLPPGQFSVKAVVRENATGMMGSFEAPLVIPELKRQPLKVSSVILSTQLQPVTGGRTDNPLVRNNAQLLPNLTHVVSRDQRMYFYYEVYDPAETASAPAVKTSLAFYRGKVKVFETQTVERTEIEAADRHAALFQLEVPADRFKPGLYTCQVNIIDEIAGRFAFPRLVLFVR
jgi:VWFA-related protein